MNTRRATPADVAARADAAFAPSAEVRIGAEVEWLVFDRSDLTRRIDAADVARIASGLLPGGGAVTIEPGGQVELVTPPHDGPRQLIDAIESDTRVLARRFGNRGLVLVPLGLDPIREPVRTLDVARYEAMERYFKEVSPAGVRMMNLTASLQLNIDFGSNPKRSWERAHAVAPVLAAAFANSPTTDGTSYRRTSNRMRIWAATDPTRTRPVGPSTDDWLPYIRAAKVLPSTAPADVVDPAVLRPFGEWVDGSNPPSLTNLDRHITTLFPPVRPRGYLEFRMLDALPTVGRAAAIATVWALMVDDGVSEAVTGTCQALGDAWRLVHDEGLDNAALSAAVTSVLDRVARSSEPQLAESVVAWSEWSGHDARRVDELIALAEAVG